MYEPPPFKICFPVLPFLFQSQNFPAPLLLKGRGCKLCEVKLILYIRLMRGTISSHRMYLHVWYRDSCVERVLTGNAHITAQILEMYRLCSLFFRAAVVLQNSPSLKCRADALSIGLRYRASLLHKKFPCLKISFSRDVLIGHLKI